MTAFKLNHRASVCCPISNDRVEASEGEKIFKANFNLISHGRFYTEALTKKVGAKKLF